MSDINTSLKIIRDAQTEGPVDVHTIADRLGLKVYNAELPDDISGQIRKDKKLGGESGYAIIVNNKHSKSRKRFTIAHEIAHFILHHDQIGDGIQEDAMYRSGLSNREEVQANQLAADILMPWSLINSVTDQGINDVKDLANALEVSEDAMSVRLYGIPKFNP